MKHIRLSAVLLVVLLVAPTARAGRTTANGLRYSGTISVTRTWHSGTGAVDGAPLDVAKVTLSWKVKNNQAVYENATASLDYLARFSFCPGAETHLVASGALSHAPLSEDAGIAWSSRGRYTVSLPIRSPRVELSVATTETGHDGNCTKTTTTSNVAAFVAYPFGVSAKGSPNGIVMNGSVMQWSKNANTCNPASIYPSPTSPFEDVLCTTTVKWHLVRHKRGS